MDRHRSRQEGSLALAILGQAGLAALLGLAACLVMLYRSAASNSLFSSIHDPAAALTLLLSVPSLQAACSGIAAFILLNVERATAGVAAKKPGDHRHIRSGPRS
jgi:hypothetical protein